MYCKKIVFGLRFTYLIDEGRFSAIPKAEAQVESIYMVLSKMPQLNLKQHQ